jgi:hypothetical protein
MTMSGGIDATYTLARHRHLLPESVRLSVESAVFVHGFDIALSDEARFEDAVRNVERITHLADLPLTVIATNFRLLQPDWTLNNGAAAAAALVCVSRGLGTGLHASGAPYDNQKVPWGSAPYFDHLFSSASFEIFHDGAAANRLDKVRALADWPEVISHLKFCWRWVRNGNCGQCQKCVLTLLMFSVCTSELPTFCPVPTSRTVEEVLRRLPMTPAVRRNLTLVVDEAQRQGLDTRWYRIGKRRLQEDRIRRAVMPSVPDGALRKHQDRVLRALKPYVPDGVLRMRRSR